MTTLTKKPIYRFNKRQTGYGHWLIELQIDNPKFDSSDEDSQEDEKIWISCTSTNSHAIDSGNMRLLTEECLIKNNFEFEEFDC